MTIILIIFALDAILCMVLMYLRYKMIYVLEEHGVRISKFAHMNIVIHKFKGLLWRQDVAELSPNFKKYAVTVAWICWYSAMLILVGAFVSVLFLF